MQQTPPLMSVLRYKGKPIPEIPTDYLKWILTDPQVRLSNEMRSYIKVELKKRGESIPDESFKKPRNPRVK